MECRLDGRAVIVTGAASGIGRAIAETAAAAGAQVLLTDRDTDGLAVVAAGIGCACATVVADLADVTAPDSIARAALDRFGRIDGLVNAAGLTSRNSFADGTPEHWDRMFAINARAPFFLMAAAIADMRGRGQGGSIVNILSVNVHCGLPSLAFYSASKGALLTLTRNAANAHMADRIRVNGINLGWVATPTEMKVQAALGASPDWVAEVSARMPFGRMVEPADCARLALFLLSDMSMPMTGLDIELEQWLPGAP